jgi:hypothetical protein
VPASTFRSRGYIKGVDGRDTPALMESEGTFSSTLERHASHFVISEFLLHGEVESGEIAKLCQCGASATALVLFCELPTINATRLCIPR